MRSNIGLRWFGRSVKDFVLLHFAGRDLANGYKAMAADERRERAAAEWVENLAADSADEP
jgi:hypothetical protein